jgi:hypothetical protein
MKNVIHINDLLGVRFDPALDQLENGFGFKYQDVWIRKEHGVLSCEAVSPTSAGSLTETEASALIDHARSLVDRLRVSSSRFNSLTHDLKLRFCVIEDYGTGTAVIVELRGNELVWSL